MNGINDYLNQLQLDKQILVDTLNAKGVEASNEETFTSLVPKVNNIQGGEDLSEYFEDTISQGSPWTYTIKTFPAFKNTGTSCENIFSGCGALTLDLSNFDTSSVTDMSGMFANCIRLTTLDLSNFNTDNVTDMYNMFNSCKNLASINLNSFNTENVKFFNYMFSGCNSLTNLNLNNFNTKNATTFIAMFSGCRSLTNLNISNFRPEKVTDMSNMFQGCGAEPLILDFSNWGSSPVTNITQMFYECNTNYLDLTGFDMSSVTNIKGAFRMMRNTETINISNFDMSNVINLDSFTFYWGTLHNPLVNLIFGKNLGAGYLTTANANYSNYTLDISSCVNLTEESLISVLNGLYDIATKGCNVQSCRLGTTNLTKLTSEEGQAALAQATSYGWAIS